MNYTRLDEAMNVREERDPLRIDEKIAELMASPYRRELIPNEDGTWFARIAELEGCMTEGETVADAIANLEDAMREWLRVQLEDGESIPEPLAALQYSGKFMVRLPKRLHRSLAECATQDGVSLNAFVSMALAREVGEHRGSPRTVDLYVGMAFEAAATQALELATSASMSYIMQNSGSYRGENLIPVEALISALPSPKFSVQS